MINNNLKFKNYFQLKHFKKKSSKKLLGKFDKIFKETEREVFDSTSTLYTLNKEFNFNFKIKDLKKFQKFQNVAIIGMGGSILGAEAIYNFFKNKKKKNFYFFNNLNEDEVTNFKKEINLSKVLFIIISKSGNTVETISNMFSLKIIKRNAKNIILISEKNNNSLHFLAKKFSLFYVEHKNYIGGRYSVLSEVGIVPALLMGINVIKLRSKILNVLNKREKYFLKESTVNLARLMNFKKIKTIIFLNYVPELEKFLYWCQQLIAESLGKNNKGFLPMISNVPKDHHSLLQLYLDGPKDKLFHIFHINKKSKEKINLNKFMKSNRYLNNKSLSAVKTAQKNALKEAFIKNGVPFREFELKSFNEESLGKLFSYFIIETVILGKLLNINPYDQPAVEQVKLSTKKILN